jgi:hypothetical protein
MSDNDEPETMLSKPGPPVDTEHPTGEKQAIENTENDPPA